jgi:hypothetical protein
MRMRLFTRRPRPSVLLAAGLALSLLSGAATITPSSSAASEPRPTATPAVDKGDVVGGFNAGWKAGVADLGDKTAATYPDVATDGSDPDTVAWVDGWIDGQSSALGDDNRDGKVTRGEAGWECRNAGTAHRLCVTVVSLPAYEWTNDDGSTVGIPNGRAQVRDLEEKPGTAAWTDALRALDAEYREHAPRV